MGVNRKESPSFGYQRDPAEGVHELGRFPMRYMLKTEGTEFEVSKAPVAKTAPNGVQKVDAFTGWPVWSVQLTTWTNEADGSDVLVVSVASPTVPPLTWRQPVEVADLEMIPWSQKGRDGDVRSGVAFRAKEIRPVGASLRVAA
jgi:hypothetical protein